MKRFFILSILLSLFIAYLFSQDLDNFDEINEDNTLIVSISVEHPGMSTGVVTDVEIMPFRRVQWEMGMQYDYINGEHSIILPTTAVRIGVSNFAEVSVQYDGTLFFNNTPAKTICNYQVQPITLATKLRVYDGWRWVPSMTFMACLAIPSTPELAKSMYVTPSIYLLCQNDITKWMHISYDLGAEWNGYDAMPTTFGALSLGFNLTENFCIFAENYNYFTRNINDSKTGVSVNVDLGFNWLVHPRVDIGLYATMNCLNPTSQTSIAFGAAWLIN